MRMVTAKRTLLVRPLACMRRMMPRALMVREFVLEALSVALSKLSRCCVMVSTTLGMRRGRESSRERERIW